MSTKGLTYTQKRVIITANIINQGRYFSCIKRSDYKVIKTKDIALTGILAGIIFMLGMTPIGLIPLGFINLTIVHIPVIVGSMVLKKKSSTVILGAAFGLASTLAAFGLALSAQSGLALALMAYSPVAVVVMCMLPRLCIPLTTRFTYDGLKKLFIKKDKYNKGTQTFAISIAAVVGSLTNTVLYLGLMGVFFAIFGIWGKFTAIFSLILFIGAICEAIAAAIIAVPVVLAVDRPNYHKEYNSESNSESGNINE